ncbi:TetR/AcrR family transcriptional regulator [Streptomyces sp. NPDC091281]|uniref:TetR/AcrR family transcriptional regulator n=1 Tax=Streptomyces sp. NPDC091281 TaxID=3365985 RepID=UPI003817C0D5
MGRPRKFDEDQVLEKARDQFWRSGYDATSMQILCEATGVASQSLYGVFGSKHDLFVRALEAYCARQVAGLASILAESPDPWGSLMDAVTFENDGRLPLGVDGCFLASSATTLARRDDRVRELSRRTYRDILGVVRGQLERARTAGQVREDVDLDSVAAGLLTSMQGIEFLAKSGLEDSLLEKARAATVAMLTAAYAGQPRNDDEA